MILFFKKTLASLILSTVFARFLSAVIGFIYTIILAKYLEVDQFGLFNLGYALITILCVFGRLGTDTLLLKRVSITYLNEPKLASSYLISCLILVTLSSSILILILFLFSDYLSSSIFSEPELSKILKIMSPFLWIYAVYLILAEVLKAVKKPVIGTIIQSVSMPLLVCITIPVFSLYHNLDATNVSVILLVCAFFVFLYSIYINIGLFQPGWSFISLSVVLKESFPMLLISSGAMLLAWTDTLILGALGNVSEVAKYTIAAKVASVILLFLTAVGSITAPYYSSLYAKNSLKTLRNIAQCSSLGLFVISLPLTIIAFVFSEEILSIFKPEYAKNSGPEMLKILIFAQLINVSAGSVGFLLSMTGREYVLGKIFIITLLLNIALDVLFYKIFGAIGVAIGTGLSIIFWNIYAIFEVRKHLGFITVNFIEIDFRWILKR